MKWILLVALLCIGNVEVSGDPLCGTDEDGYLSLTYRCNGETGLWVPDAAIRQTCDCADETICVAVSRPNSDNKIDYFYKCVEELRDGLLNS